MFNKFNILDILLSLPAVFLAFSFHEYAHALVADRMGDPTPKMQGRLTLAPLAHVDWIGLIMFSVFGFGWAKPVQVNPANFRNRKKGDVLVSLAGPISNLILAFITLFILRIVGLINPAAYMSGLNSTIGVLGTIFYKVASLNIVFAYLNLIPIPPFDGYRIIKTLFFRRNIKFFWVLERYSIIVLFAMIIFNLFDIIIGIPYKYTYMFFDEIAVRILRIFV